MKRLWAYIKDWLDLQHPVIWPENIWTAPAVLPLVSLDCGHTHWSYAISHTGKTQCRDCYEKR